MMVLELLALLFTTAFTAIAVYVAVVEHPARLASDPSAALAQWRPSYRRAAVMQVVLAAGGVITAIGAYVARRGIWVLVGGLVLGLVVPFTLLVIMGTNKQLLDERRDGNTPGTRHLLEQWGRLHWARTVISLVAVAILAAHVIDSLR